MLSCRDWIVMITLPCTLMMSSYSSFNLSGLLPLFQNDFNLSDTDAAWLKTSNSIAHGLAFSGMWLFGDCLPKKAAFLSSLGLWILFNFASILVTSDQFLLFVILRSLDSMIGEVFRILITVMQAEHFKGKYLTAALTANIVCESIAILVCSTMNSIFVANDSGWRVALIISPTLAIPLLISNAFFLRSNINSSIPHPVSALKNAVGVLRIPSNLLMVISQCITMVYSDSLMFWIPSMVFSAFESVPSVYLGLSYPVISSTMSIVVFVGMLVAAFLVPYAIHSLEAGSGLFGFISPTALAIPMVYIACIAMLFVDGAAGCGITLINQQITLSTIPSKQRASAFALHKLMIALFNLPSAQIIAAISDFFRCDSTDPADRLGALQKTFLVTWFMPVISTVMCLFILRFYRRDVNNAKRIDLQNQEETAPLISEKPSVN